MLTKNQVRVLCRNYFDSVNVSEKTLMDMFFELNDIIDEAVEFSNIKRGGNITALTDYTEDQI